MAESVFDNLPRLKRAPEDNRGFREVFGRYQPEGPLPPGPRPSGKGGPSVGQTVTPPVVTSVWSASDAAANGMTLSNGGLTVTPSGVATWAAIRSSIGKTSGKLYVEFSNSAVIGAHSQNFGFASSSFNIGSYLSSSNYSCAVGPNAPTGGSSGFTSNYSDSFLSVVAQNDVVALAIDFTAGSIWLGKNNIWSNGTNPATGTLPILSFAPATVGALFAGMSFEGPGVGVWTLQPTSASQKYLPPPGFQAWDGGPVTPVTNVWSAADAAANGMTLSNGGLTVTPSGVTGNQALRGSVSHNTGKWYVEFLATVAASNAAMMFGFADTTFNATNQYLGSNGVSVGVQLAGASYTTSGFTVPTNIPVTTPHANDVWMLAIDFAGKAWLGLNNAWFNGGNPSFGTTPLITIAAPALGVALFPGMTFYGAGQGVWTLQPTAASQAYAPPTGFSPWG